MQSALFPVCSILVHGFDTVHCAFALLEMLDEAFNKLLATIPFSQFLDIKRLGSALRGRIVLCRRVPSLRARFQAQNHQRMVAVNFDARKSRGIHHKFGIGAFGQRHVNESRCTPSRVLPAGFMLAVVLKESVEYPQLVSCSKRKQSFTICISRA